VEENILGHLLNANDAETQAEVERLLANDPSARRQRDLLKLALAPLSASREPAPPASDLWRRTLEKVAEEIVAREGHAPRPASCEPKRYACSIKPPSASFTSCTASEGATTTPARRNVLAGLALACSFAALMLPAIVYVRAQSQQVACQNSMQTFYQSLAQYSDTNDGNFPQVAKGENVSHMAQTLRMAGYLAPSEKLHCPSNGEKDSTVLLANYAYCLGYRGPDGALHGLKRGTEDGLLPILADAPLRETAKTIPVNHKRGQNVLFNDGHVRFCTTALVGVQGDDIFRNEQGLVGAGLHKFDSVLGCAYEQP
jgi:prepilin-type processing-associated H-X9-DG protein